jgi:ParB/RepB/Spo0J family partition protein
MIPLDEIRESGSNPRKTFGQKSLDELTESVRERGVLEPILVRPAAEMAGEGIAVTRFEIVAGTRRFRASRAAGRYDIPSIVHDVDDVTALEMRVTENLHREDVHPMEEGEGYRELLETGHYGEGREGVTMLAGRVNRSVSYVYQRLKLLELIDEAKKEFVEGGISAGVAAELCRLTPETQKEALTQAIYEPGWDAKNERRKMLCGAGELRRWLDHEVFRRLGVVPWGLDDEALVKAAGSCTACMKRTGHDGVLFDESPAEDRCLDGKCYDGKRKAFLDMQLKTAEKFSGKPIKVTTRDWGYENRPLKEFKEVKRETEGAIAVVVAETDDFRKFGKIVYVAPPTKESKGNTEADRLRKEENAAQKRKADICRSYRMSVLDAVFSQGAADRELLIRVVTRLWDRSGSTIQGIVGRRLGLKPVMKAGYGGKEEPSYEGCLATNPEALGGQNWLRLLLFLAWGESAHQEYFEFGTAEACALAFEVDLELLKKQAEMEHEKPKPAAKGKKGVSK